MQYQAGVIGRFGFGKNLLNGQTIKTKILVQALEKELGEENLLFVDTYGGARMLLRLPFQCFAAACRCRNLIILPAHKGIRVIAPLLTLINLLFHRRLHYVVIGGWINDLLKNRKALAWCLKRFDWIYAETSSMKRKLEADGFDNVVQMPNFKNLTIQEDVQQPTDCEPACRLCIFSRILREKGIADGVEAVRAVNAQLKKTAFRLDIYGQVDEKQTQWFADLQSTFPETVRYCGAIDFSESVSVLKDYDALLFPTRFYTEGIPGTIIDAYAAGIPVIASIWENYSDIVDEETGIGYAFGDSLGLQSALLSVAADPAALKKKRAACLRKARQFMPEAVMPVLLSRLA